MNKTMKIILATNNKNKLREMREITSGLDIEIISQSDAGISIDPEETGSTFAENAYIKAKAALDASGLPAIADDSGLCVDALGGEPGVYSARYGPGKNATDRDKYMYLLDKLKGENNRKARFVCSVCCLFPNGDRLSAEDSLEGSIQYEPTGTNGFGYDPVFVPDGYTRSNAELTPEEKNAISHRGKATRAIVLKLKEYLENGNNK